MKKIMFRSLLICLTVFLIFGLDYPIAAQTTGDNERYNLAVYATGTQNDQPLSTSLQTVVQNKTITKLTGEGNYRLIERSGEFLKEIQNEQKMQQSGDVADGQIAEIGAGYGAQKICVVSVTIIDKYLYIATRIVDVATKTSYESGEAEVTNYKDIPVLTKTLDVALNTMLATTYGRNYMTPTQEITNSSHDLSSSNLSETTANTKAAHDSYVKRLKKEKGGFLDMNSMAYLEYQKYKKRTNSGAICLTLGLTGMGAGIPIMILGLVPGDSFLWIISGSATARLKACESTAVSHLPPIPAVLTDCDDPSGSKSL